MRLAFGTAPSGCRCSKVPWCGGGMTWSGHVAGRRGGGVRSRGPSDGARVVPGPRQQSNLGACCLIPARLPAAADLARCSRACAGGSNGRHFGASPATLIVPTSSALRGSAWRCLGSETGRAQRERPRVSWPGFGVVARRVIAPPGLLLRTTTGVSEMSGIEATRVSSALGRVSHRHPSWGG